MMLSFRKKILISDLLVFLIVAALLFPLVNVSLDYILRTSLKKQGKSLISQLQQAPDRTGMIELMKTEPSFPFFSARLLDANANELIHKSSDWPEEFYYVSLPFTAQNASYLLQLGFNSKWVGQLKLDLEIGLLILILLLLALTSISNLLIVHCVTQPIQTIVNAIRLFREGKKEFLPRIVLKEAQQGGEFSTLASLLNELSERIQRQIEKLTRQREETKEILESIGEGVIATDSSAKVTYVNRTACQMIGVSHAEMMKQTLNTIKAPTLDLTKKCHELILFALQTSEPIVQTWTIREANPIHLDLIAAPLPHHNGALVVLQDKTSEYKVVEMGKDFISNASHELRTPITIIRGFAETLQDLPDLSQEMLKEITEKIVRTCGRLDKLVRSLLTLSDIENLSPDRFKPADLLLLAEECKHLLMTAHPNVHITLKSELESAPIIADGDLLELAISNILENAVKYSQAPAHIQMSLYRSNETVCLEIQDKGIGISEKDLPHIFERFYTVDKARSRKSGGAGLGLSIVKTIIDKHRGKIRAVSELGKGSTFTLYLNLQPLT